MKQNPVIQQALDLADEMDRFAEELEKIAAFQRMRSFHLRAQAATLQCRAILDGAPAAVLIDKEIEG